MSSTDPIGVFDSGIGGVSILTELRQLLPAEDLIYFADSAYCPYGTKPLEAIRARALAVTEFLISKGAKAVVVACNSAGVAGLDQIRAKYPALPVVGVEPALKPAHQVTKNGRIGILATNLTLQGNRFSLLVERYGTGVEVYTQPAPGLVEMVEAGKFDDPVTERALHQYLDPLLERRIDVLVLGCTHYPFLRPALERICGPTVTILDTGPAVAQQTARVLKKLWLLNQATTAGRTSFYTSGAAENVTGVIQKIWSEEPVEVWSVTLG